MACVSMRLVQSQLCIVSRSEGSGIFRFVLLVVGVVDPCKRVHEPVISVREAGQRSRTRV